MGEIFADAAGFPTLLFTAGLAVAAGFWLLVALGAVAATAFDEDVDLRAMGLGGVPVAAALSLVMAVAWSVSVTGSVVAGRLAVAGIAQAALSGVLLFGSPLVGWWVARVIVSPPAKRAPDEPGPSPFGVDAEPRGEFGPVPSGSRAADH